MKDRNRRILTALIASQMAFAPEVAAEDLLFSCESNLVNEQTRLEISEDFSSLQFGDSQPANIVFSDHRLISSVLLIEESGDLIMTFFNMERGTNLYVRYVSGPYCGGQHRCQGNQLTAFIDEGKCERID